MSFKKLIKELREPTPDEYYTTKRAAEKLGYSDAAVVRALIAKGKLKARKVGRDWVIRPIDLAAFELTRFTRASDDEEDPVFLEYRGTTDVKGLKP